MKQSVSLESWRDYFRRGDSDIFGIIDYAIMVAAADFPSEFKSRRDGIAELLFSCGVSRCIGCDHLELSIAADKEGNRGGGGDMYDSGVATEDETKSNHDQIGSNQTYGEDSVLVDEVMRIKDILLNKEYEPNSLLLDCLRKLASMPMTVNILKDTEIGKAVNGLRRHSSDKIRELARTLFAEWKEVVDQWMNTPKEIAGDEWTPESANLSVVEEEEVFPSPPHDLDIYTHDEPNGYELSQILDCLDCDGNPRDSVEANHEMKLQSSARRRPEGTNQVNVVGRYNKDQQMRRDEVEVRPMKHSDTVFDEPRRQPKQNREQMAPSVQRKPLVVAAEQKQKLTRPRQDNLKDLDPDTKFEFAKRKLQESYQQHDKAKRQRTIQVLEAIPKQSKAQKPQFKRPIRK
ncbi:unnamed protein product [Cochlearia groenlandica]